MADTADADCVVHRKGDPKQVSGRCQFSQRQAYVTIPLKTGDVWDLKPGDEANHYRDKDNHKVKGPFWSTIPMDSGLPDHRLRGNDSLERTGVPGRALVNPLRYRALR